MAGNIVTKVAAAEDHLRRRLLTWLPESVQDRVGTPR
jgi:hypothetical protein